jgi:integrase
MVKAGWGNAMKDPLNYWSPKEVEAILKAAYAQDEEKALALETLWLSGRREGELLGSRAWLADIYKKEGKEDKIVKGLRPQNINGERGEILWWLEKRNKVYVWLPESPTLINKLQAWIIKKGLKSDQNVFNISDQQLRRFLHGLLKQGLFFVDEKGMTIPVKTRGSSDKRVCGLHTLRHSHGSFVEQTCGLAAAQDRLQHRSIVTTGAYIHAGRNYSDKLFDEMAKTE